MGQWSTISRGTRFHVLFFSTVILAGLGCFLFAQFGAQPEIREFVLGLGVALMPAGLIGLIHRLFFFDELKAEVRPILHEAIQDAVGNTLLPFLENGVVRFTRDRQAIVQGFRSHLEKEVAEVIVVGSSLKGILDPKEEVTAKKDLANLIRRRRAAGVRFRFLLTHPALAFLREDAEGRQAGDIRSEIIETLRYLTRPDEDEKEGGKRGLGIPHGDIKLYKGTPTIFSLVTSDRLFLNPYTYQATAYDSFCIEVERKGSNDMYGRFVNDHFHKPWSNERTTVTLSPEVLEDLSGETLRKVFPDRIADLGLPVEAQPVDMVTESPN